MSGHKKLVEEHLNGELASMVMVYLGEFENGVELVLADPTMLNAMLAKLPEQAGYENMRTANMDNEERKLQIIIRDEQCDLVSLDIGRRSLYQMLYARHDMMSLTCKQELPRLIAHVLRNAVAIKRGLRLIPFQQSRTYALLMLWINRILPALGTMLDQLQGKLKRIKLSAVKRNNPSPK